MNLTPIQYTSYFGLFFIVVFYLTRNSFTFQILPYLGIIVIILGIISIIQIFLGATRYNSDQNKFILYFRLLIGLGFLLTGLFIILDLIFWTKIIFIILLFLSVIFLFVQNRLNKI